MKNKILGKFFYSGFQAVGLQVLGVFFFYLISLNLSKENFGFISWANALCVFFTSFLSGGMEQVVVRRIAVSKTSDWAAAAYLFHSFISSIIVFAVLVILNMVFTGSDTFHYLPFFFIAQALFYIASPLKQFLNAKENFAPYGIIAIISNLGKICAALFFIKSSEISINKMLLILISFATFELISLFVYVLNKSSLNFSFRFRFTAYKKLLKESAPQYLAVIFDSSLSRMDWILLGFISTTVITADYSFAYRAYEIARLPITIAGPVLLPRFARMLTQNNEFDQIRKENIKHLYVTELFFSTGMVLLLNIIWAPAISQITNGKYGYSNSIEFLILSFGIPIQFFINLLWTLCFAGRNYKAVSSIIILSAIINVILNLVLISIFGGIGAAIAFLITGIVQVIGYYRIVKREYLSFSLKYILFFYTLGCIIYFGSGIIGGITIFRVLFAAFFYISLSFIFRLINKQDFVSLKLFLNS